MRAILATALLLAACGGDAATGDDFTLQTDSTIMLQTEDYTGAVKHRFYRDEAVYVRFAGLPLMGITVIGIAAYGSPSHHIVDHLHYKATMEPSGAGLLGFYGVQAPLQEGLYVIRAFTRPSDASPVEDWIPLKEGAMFEVWNVPAPSQQS